MRWALSYYIDRDAIVEVAWSGASEVTPLPLPSYPPLMPYFDNVSDLLEQYNTLEFNPEKGDALLSAKGWEKDGDGMWHDENGEKIVLPIVSFFDFTSVGPVVVEFLKRSGIDASYSEPPGWFAPFSEGDFEGALFGHGGSCKEPQETLSLYQSASEAIPGGHSVNFSKWDNPEFDKLADEAFVTDPNDTEALLDIWRRAMEIWLPELPDIQLTQGSASFAVDNQVLEWYAGSERSVHQLRFVAPNLPVGTTPSSAEHVSVGFAAASDKGAAAPFSMCCVYGYCAPLVICRAASRLDRRRS